MRQNKGLTFPASSKAQPATPQTSLARFALFDTLATLVAVVRLDGTVVYANGELEHALWAQSLNLH